jgi:hypothetical protein
MNLAMGRIELKQRKSYFFRHLISWFVWDDHRSSIFELEPTTFHNTESDYTDGVENSFVWSFPTAKILVRNLPKLSLEIEAPFTQEVEIEYGDDLFKFKMQSGRRYKVEIDTQFIDYVQINAETYNPLDDVRELGLKFLSVS